jgi:hypothetical protein
MRSHNVLRFLVLNGIAIGLGASVATSCIGVNYPTVAFRCNPRQQDNCPESHVCCSDDPAAENGGLPEYMGKNIPGAEKPFFSGANNQLGTSGLCVNVEEIPFGSGLVEPQAANCPIPCNPTWDGEDVEAVCGTGRVCCQTVQLQEADCVLDPADEGSFRPVTGEDIGVAYSNGQVVTNWAPGEHATHQDPGGSGCRGFAMNMMTGPVWEDCVSHLTVANQRGFCMALAPTQVCPVTQAGYVDACSAKNGAAPAVPPA